MLTAFVAVSLSQFTALPLARAAIVATGDVRPADPSDWSPGSHLQIGMTTNGAVVVDDGSAIESFTGAIGYYAGAVGTVRIEGAGSRWTNATTFNVGRYGQGTLDIFDGAVAKTDGVSASIGYDPGSTGVVTIDGAGSQWICSRGLLYVGNGGSGTLTISGGGAVSNTSGSIGSPAGSIGSVTVNGASSSWTNTSDLHVGSAGNGLLSVTDGGTVNVSGTTWLGRQGGSGKIEFGATGGTLATGSLAASPTQL
ncbi:MAG: hypothetical protein ACOY3P_20870, partial [Planctomycetota bacterium]